jgi:hypothetical protein
MSVLRTTKIVLLAGVFSLPLGYAAHAADLILYPEPFADAPVDLTLPAVSGPNGKLELALGGITDPDTAVFRAAGSFSLPVGDAFGLQGDVAVQNFDGDWAVGGALHAFTRDPSSYLFGLTGGFVAADGVTLAAIGPEAELYLDRVSLEFWAGWAAVEYDDALLDDDDGMFAFGDLAYYVTDDWRVSIGGASVLGSEWLRLATEYQFTGLGTPISGTGEFRAYDTGSYSAMIGIKGYFGGDPGKSLIDRHRQDDPPNRVLDLFGAASLLTATPGDAGEPVPSDFADNESGCLDAGFEWTFPGCEYPINA